LWAARGITTVAYDRDEDLFHLTPTGWARKSDEPFPSDRVETWSYDMYQASGFSKEIVTFKRVWINEEVDQAQRDEMRKKFGFPYKSTRSREVSIHY
jgi:hypothetical protein